MEIYELNTFSGTPGSGDYLATDNGNDTSKIAITDITDPLNARIDNIIAGPAPSAEEIIDARLGANGVTYASLGNAVRGQANWLDGKILANKTGLIGSAPVNLLLFSEKTSNTHQGVTYTWDEKGETCTVSGTATATSFNTIINNVMPDGFEVGKKYYVFNANPRIHVYVYATVNGALTTLLNATSDSHFIIPANATSLLVRLWVASGTTVNEQITPQIIDISKLTLKVDPSDYYTSANEIAERNPCIYFVSSVGGQPTISDVPFFPCWLYTVRITPANANARLQIAYPYNLSSNVTPKVRVRQLNGTWTEWVSMGSAGGTTTIVQEVSRDTYENEYNITTSPTITTDTNGWLQPVDTDTQSESGKTDMTGAIMSMLTSTGYCHLAEGIYYVSGNIDIPAGATLEGCGRGTIIRLLGSVSSGYICRLKEYSTIKNIRFSGGYNQGDISDGNIGGRKGVIFIGNRDGQDAGVTPASTKCCQITGCWFENLDSGIYGYNSGGGLQEGMIVSDCYITRCKAGINLDYWTEYCKFTNIVVFQCYYACINNGGNNVFTACTFHGVIGFLIDNSGGNKPNNGHGTLNGCTFNHIDNMNNPGQLGKGLAIKILGTEAGFIISNCQLWYGRVHIESSKGIQLTGCEFGGIGGEDYPLIETSGDHTLFVDNCLFQTTPTNSINTPVKFTNCWTYSGSAVTQ